jgi:excinuclease ABC subunit B
MDLGLEVPGSIGISSARQGRGIPEGAPKKQGRRRKGP